MKKIAIINGPNMDRLGERETEVYGTQTLSDLEDLIRKEAEKLNVEVRFFQSNHEGLILDQIGEFADSGVDAFILNPGALAHTSVALRDALAASGIPVMEVHMSNIYGREAFRQHSFTASVCIGVISGLGFYSYICALRYLVNHKE